jgi:1-acyl-sn-glycerol-3-phosphate acyltransferase
MRMLSSWPKVLFVTLIVRPIVWLSLGLHIVHRERLPLQGPRIIVAMRMLPRVRPVAAADYFLTTRWLSWIARTLIGIIPVSRTGEGVREHVLDSCTEALQRGDILIFFPEGTRGEPGQMAPLRKGIYHLAKSHPACAVVPVFLQGLGKALPRGETVLVPFNCAVVVGEEMTPTENADAFVAQLSATLQALASVVEKRRQT